MAVRREQVIRTAEKYVSKGRIDAAIKEYSKVLERQPEDVNTLNRLGDLYARIERYDEAVKLFEKIAEGYTDDGFFVKAIAIYKKIIKLDPTRLEIYERLAELYHKQGLINEARTQYQVLADYYTKHDNPTSAINIYREMAELEPENPSHHAKLAELYAGLKLTDKAMGEYATIAELMIDHGHPEDAVQVYRKALDIDDGNLEFMADAATRLKESGHVAEAARFLALAVERNPEARTVAQRVGMERKAEPETAEPAAAVATELEPEGVAQDGLEEDSSVELVLDLDDTGPGVGEALAEAAEAAALETPEPEASSPELLEAGGLDPEALDVEIPEVDLPDVEMPEVELTDVELADSEAEAGTATGELDVDTDGAFVLDLEDEEPSPSLVQPPADMMDGRPARAFLPDDEAEPATEVTEEPTAVPRVSPEDRVEVDPAVLERTVSDLEPPSVTQRDDSELVSEAEVLAKYGMIDKALERLREALSLKPENLEAHEVMLRIYLDEGEHEAVRRMAARMAKTADRVGDSERWPKMRERLERAGFLFEESAPDQPPTPPPESREKKPASRVDRLLEDLVHGFAPRRKKSKPASPPSPQPLEPLDREAAVGGATVPETGTEIPESLRSLEEDDITLRGIFDEVEVEDAPPQPPAGAPPWEATLSPTPSPEPEAEAQAPSGDDGTSWLDEVEAEAASSGAEAEIYETEGDFFDLAGELEEELSREEAMDGSPLVQAQEQSLEEIVEGFKQGVAENLSPEDHDTHFNLGIAYREMGLLDEAIGEFQVAAKSRPHLVECCSMLGLCFLDKGLPELAVKWYRQGLETLDLTEEETLGLLYDMGNVYLTIDDREAAQRTFVELYGINSNYRDVVAKLEELKKT